MLLASGNKAKAAAARVDFVYKRVDRLNERVRENSSLLLIEKVSPKADEGTIQKKDGMSVGRRGGNLRK